MTDWIKETILEAKPYVDIILSKKRTQSVKRQAMNELLDMAGNGDAYKVIRDYIDGYYDNNEDIFPKPMKAPVKDPDADTTGIKRELEEMFCGVKVQRIKRKSGVYVKVEAEVPLRIMDWQRVVQTIQTYYGGSYMTSGSQFERTYRIVSKD